jgi:hypothetical protein
MAQNFERQRLVSKSDCPGGETLYDVHQFL